MSFAARLAERSVKIIPFAYSLRWARRLTTALTAGGMALVVFVFAAVLMLDQGLKEALVDRPAGQRGGDPEGLETEVQSVIERSQAALVESLPQIARGAGGCRWYRARPWCSSTSPSATATSRPT
jgi:hypothetical protein